MSQTKYMVKFTTQFRKDYKLAIKRGLKIELLEQIVALLAAGQSLPERIKITHLPATGSAIENVTFCLIGSWSTELRTMFWY